MMIFEQIEAFKTGYNNGFITNEIRDAFWLAIDKLVIHNAIQHEALEAVESDGLLDHLAACEIGRSATKVPPKRSVYDALSATKDYAKAWEEAFSKKAVEAYLGTGAYADGKAAMGRSMQDANDEETALMDIENIYDNLTPEDIARIKEISL